MFRPINTKRNMDEPEFELILIQIAATASEHEIANLLHTGITSWPKMTEPQIKVLQLAVDAQQDFLDQKSYLLSCNFTECHKFVELYSNFDYKAHLIQGLELRRSVVYMSPAQREFYLNLRTANQAKLVEFAKMHMHKKINSSSAILTAFKNTNTAHVNENSTFKQLKLI